MATVDRAFIAVNYEEDDIGDNPNRSLCRYEFMEILVRLADAKYRVNKASKFADTFNTLIQSLIEKVKFKDWQDFRSDFLWAH